MSIVSKLKKIKNALDIPEKYTWPKVIMFHSSYPIINRGDTFHNWNSSTQRIIGIIDYLKNYCEIINEDEFLNIKKHNQHINSEGKFLLSFDDGYKLIYSQLSDYICKNKIEPVLFLSAGQFINQAIPWFAKITLLIRHSRRTVFAFQKKIYDITDLAQRFSFYSRIQEYVIHQCVSIEQVDNMIDDLLFQSQNLSNDNLVLDEDMKLLSKQEIGQLLVQGWTLGSHGFTHYPLTILNEKMLSDDLIQSKKIIEDSFNIKVRSISYPNGCINKRVLEKVKCIYEAGFCAVPLKRSSQYLIPRFGFPENENKIRKQIWKVSEASAMLKTGKNGFSSSLPLMLLNKNERSLLINSYFPKHKTLNSNIAQIDGLTWDIPSTNGKENDSDKFKPEIVLLCGSGVAERYALTTLSKIYNITAVIVDSFGSCQKYPAFRAPQSKKCLPKDLPTHLLTPYYKYYNKEQENILGSDSLSWFLCSHTKLYSVSTINHPDVISLILSFNPSLILVFGTGIIRNTDLLSSNIPKYNLHWGLSPWYRGSHTLRWPVYENNIDAIGVTVHEIDNGVDSGSIISQAKPSLDGTENIMEIEYKCTIKGVELFADIIDRFKSGKTPLSIKQNLSDGEFYSVKKWNPSIKENIEHALNDGFVYKCRCRKDAIHYSLVQADWK